MNEEHIQYLVGEHLDQLRKIAQTLDDIYRCAPISRRERIATAAMQGLLANPGHYDEGKETIAMLALYKADALIAELDKPGDK